MTVAENVNILNATELYTYRVKVVNSMYILPQFSIFKKILKVYFEKECVRKQGKGQRERERENPKQATWGLSSRTSLSQNLGHDLMVREFEPHVTCFSLSLSGHHPACTHTLSK